METHQRMLTHEQYIETLIDASFQDASELALGFFSWCQRHVPTWREQGYDELWIRQRIDAAKANLAFHRGCQKAGFSLLEKRALLHQTYAAYPELYDMAREHERCHPGLLRYRGNAYDLRQRYTLRLLLYEADKLVFLQLCQQGNVSSPSPDMLFCEQPDEVRVIRDLSTVEELEMMLTMSQYALQLCTEGHLSLVQMAPLLEDYGKQIRTDFRNRCGYCPEESVTSYIPVTIDGPQDHDDYYAKEYAG